jgi:MBA1-like protein
MQIYGSLWNPKTYFKGKEHRWSKRKLITEAEDMYVNMYTAYAQGRRSDLHDFCGEGILSSLESRMTRRGVGAVMEWNLISFNSKPEMVSRSVGMGPKVLGRKLSYQQAIFNIKSTQTLKRGRQVSSGTVEWQKNTKKVVNEYLVLQRRFLDDVPDNWFLWGFLNGDNIMTFKRFLKQQQKQKIEAKQNSILDGNVEHQSHKTVRDIAQGVNQPAS